MDILVFEQGHFAHLEPTGYQCEARMGGSVGSRGLLMNKVSIASECDSKPPHVTELL